MSAGPHISDEQLEEVIARIPDGMSLKKSCELSGFNYSNVLRRIHGNEALSNSLTHAREDYQMLRVDEMRDIAEQEPDVQRARLICDNIKWEAARIGRKQYSEKIDLNHSGANGGPIQHSVKPDLTGLSDAELSLLETITGKLAKSGSNPDGEGTA